MMLVPARDPLELRSMYQRVEGLNIDPHTFISEINSNNLYFSIDFNLILEIMILFNQIRKIVMVKAV